MRKNASERDAALPRSLGIGAIWLLTVNGMVGAGIFGLPGGAAKLAGGFSPVVFALCAVLILPVLLCFAELASRFRSSGGPALYATEAFGPFMGFQAGWLFYVARAIAFSANSVLMVDSIGYFWPAAAEGAMRTLLLASICGGLALVNVVGTVQAVRSLSVLTALKFAVLVGLVAVGLAFAGDGALRQVALSPMPDGSLDAAIVLVIYAYVGFEQAVVPAGEARDPARDMPRGLLLGLAVVAVLYVLIQMVSLAVLPDIAASATPLLDVAATLMGPLGASLLMLGVLASVGGNLAGTMFATPRLSYSLGLDGRLPLWFARVNPRFSTPANSIVFFAALSFAMATFGSFLWLATASVLTRLLLYILTCAAVPALRRRHAGRSGFALPLGPLFPALGIVACAWLLLNVNREAMLLTAAFVLAGSGLYALQRWRTR